MCAQELNRFFFQGFARLLAYLRAVRGVLRESDPAQAEALLQEAKVRVGKETRRLLQGAERDKRPGAKNRAHQEALGPGGTRTFNALYKLRRSKSGAYAALFSTDAAKTYAYYAWAAWLGATVVGDHLAGVAQPKLSADRPEEEQVADLFLEGTDPTGESYRALAALYQRLVANVKAIKHKTLDFALEAAFSVNGFTLQELRRGLAAPRDRDRYRAVLLSTWRTWERWSVLTNLAALGSTGQPTEQSVVEQETEKKQKKHKKSEEEKKKKKKKKEEKKKKKKGKEKVSPEPGPSMTVPPKKRPFTRESIEQKELVFAAFGEAEEEPTAEMRVLARATRVGAPAGEEQQRSPLERAIPDTTRSERLVVEREEQQRAQSEAREFRDAVCKAEALAVHEKRAHMTVRYYRLLYYIRRYRDVGRLWALMPRPRTAMERYQHLMQSAEWGDEELQLHERLYRHSDGELSLTERELRAVYEAVHDWQPVEHLKLEWSVSVGLTVDAWQMVRNTQTYLEQMDYDGRDNLASVHAFAGLLREELVRRWVMLTNDRLPVSPPTKRKASLSVLLELQQRTALELRKLDQAVHCVFVNNCPAPRTDVGTKALVLGLEAHPTGWMGRFLAFLRLISPGPGLGTSSRLPIVADGAPGSRSEFTRAYHANVFYSAHDGFVLLAEQSNALSDDVPPTFPKQTLLDMVVGRNPPGKDLGVEERHLVPTQSAADLVQHHQREGMELDPMRVMRDEMLKRTSHVQRRMEQHRRDRDWTRTGVSYLMACLMPDALHWIAVGEVRAAVLHRVPVTTLGEGGLSDQQLDAFGEYLREANVARAAELLESTRAYVQTGGDDALQRAIEHLGEEQVRQTEALRYERNPRRRADMQRAMDDNTQLRSTLEHVRLARDILVLLPKLIDRIELEEKPTLQAQLLELEPGSARATKLQSELQYLEGRVREMGRAQEQWEKIRALQTDSQGLNLPRNIVSQAQKILSGSNEGYPRALVPAATPLHQPHSLDGGAAEYTSWLLRNRGGRQVPLPHDRYNVQELVCGVCPRTTSVGDWYLKSAEHQMEPGEFVRAARRAIDRNLPGAREGFDGDARERAAELEDLTNDALAHYRDALTRLPVVREPDALDQGRYAWQRDDEGVVLASGQFWRRVDKDTVAQVFFRTLYGRDVNAARPRTMEPREAETQAKQIERALVDLYSSLYAQQQERLASDAPDAYVKVFLLQIRHSQLTAAPITAAPVTAAPVTAAPVTAAPVTAAPATAAPATAAPDNPGSSPSDPPPPRSAFRSSPFRAATSGQEDN